MTDKKGEFDLEEPTPLSNGANLNEMPNFYLVAQPKWQNMKSG